MNTQELLTTIACNRLGIDSQDLAEPLFLQLSVFSKQDKVSSLYHDFVTDNQSQVKSMTEEMIQQKNLQNVESNNIEQLQDYVKKSNAQFQVDDNSRQLFLNVLRAEHKCILRSIHADDELKESLKEKELRLQRNIHNTKYKTVSKSQGPTEIERVSRIFSQEQKQYDKVQKLQQSITIQMEQSQLKRSINIQQASQRASLISAHLSDRREQIQSQVQRCITTTDSQLRTMSSFNQLRHSNTKIVDDTHSTVSPNLSGIISNNSGNLQFNLSADHLTSSKLNLSNSNFKQFNASFKQLVENVPYVEEPRTEIKSTEIKSKEQQEFDNYKEKLKELELKANEKGEKTKMLINMKKECASNKNQVWSQKIMTIQKKEQNILRHIFLSDTKQQYQQYHLPTYQKTNKIEPVNQLCCTTKIQELKSKLQKKDNEIRERQQQVASIQAEIEQQRILQSILSQTRPKSEFRRRIKAQLQNNMQE